MGNATMFHASNARRYQDNNAIMLPDKYQDRNANKYQNKDVEMFPESNAKTSQDKNVEMYQDRYKEMNAEMYPGNSAITSLVSNVKMFHDKYVHKLVMAVNFLSHSTKENLEQTSVDITSPISIILQLSYVIFIFTSSFGLK